MTANQDLHRISLTVNGEQHELDVDSRRHLADVLREDLGLTGTHLGCEHGVCGACTVSIDGGAARACLVLAVQADGSDVVTIEGIRDESDPNGMGLVQRAMWEKHSFQCAFCAPGFMMTVQTMLDENPAPTPEEVKDNLSGNLCRCTGYHSILEGVNEAIAQLATTKAGPSGATGSQGSSNA